MAAVERIVVQATLQDKQAFAEKARRLDLPLSELMRRGGLGAVQRRRRLGLALEGPHRPGVLAPRCHLSV